MALNLSTYKLTFQDEFTAFSRYNGTAGSGTWKTWLNYNDRTLPNNGEIQMYMDPDFKGLGVNPFGVSADPSQAGDGVLDITAKPADAWVKPYINNYAYTSGMITTQATFSQQYGYFEMRAKLPEGKGLWPAFWLLPTAPTWPPEIDVMEAFGGPNSRGEGGASSYHWNEISTQPGAGKGDWVTVPGVNFYQEFHTFGVDWQPDYITYYLDGQQVGRAATPSDMHQPMYMLANIAVGGGWAETPPAGTTGTMQIDYIRAYSKDANAAVYAGNTGMSNPSPTTGTTAGTPAIPADTSVVATTGAITNWLAAGVTAGTAGNDSLTGQWGDTQTFRGGRGDDTYGVASRGMQIVENAGEGIDTVSAWVSYTLSAYVENIVVGANYGIAITGNDGANMLKGNVGNDTLTGKGGSDLFIMARGGGQDIITDFRIDEDQIQLDGYGFANFDAVRAAMSASGRDVVLNLGNGESLTLQGHAIADFAGADFGMDSGSRTGAVVHASSLATLPGWKLAATGDFNNDGTEDLVWRNATTGQNVLSVMHDGQAVGSRDLGTFTGWEVGALGDFNGDGSSDIVWRNTASGQNFIWLMQDGQPMKSYFGGNIPGWTLASSSDLNGDGTTDLLWRNLDSGENYLWLMDDGQPYNTYALGKIPGWQIGGGGDVDGDGTADLLWQNISSGDTFLWLMKNGQPAQSWSLGSQPGAKVAEIADFNGDGTEDILWINPTNGRASIWTMDNGRRAHTEDLGTLSGRHVTGAADIDGDGVTELLMDDPGSTQFVGRIATDWM